MSPSLKRRMEKWERQTNDFSQRLTMLLDPNGAASEAFRTLCTSLLYARMDQPPKVIVVTSFGAREGKSTTCANLAIALAQTGRSTLLLDCDFRRPVVHRVFELRNLKGTVDVLMGQNQLEEVWQEPLPNLKVLTTGPISPNPAELVGSRRFVEFLKRVRNKVEYVLIDAPPVAAVSDSLTLATQADGVLLVLDARKTRKVNVRRAVRSLEAVGANVIGTVMNNVKRTGGDYYGYTS